MIQLQILSGKMAGNVQVVRRFPFSIGRGSECALQLIDEGVWNDHLTLQFQPQDGFILQTATGTIVAVNDQAQTAVRLRNGDILSLGSVKIQFSLTASQQHGQQVRELFLWTILVLVTFGQFALIFWLLGEN
jgi:pSer/pThr/pTyr-binding forkhead associated (FHA) protein